jgi:uncharacterized protein involved in response to NO
LIFVIPFHQCPSYKAVLMALQIPVTIEQDKGERNPAPGSALFGLGFRPFFLLAGIGAVVLVALWIAVYLKWLPFVPAYGGVYWHAHEMVFGYSVAVIGGFLLTAVRNWTGVPTVSGKPLAWLSLLWLAGRVAPLIPALPVWGVAALDLAFLPALTLAVAHPLWKARHVKSYVFPALLAGMAVANLATHLYAQGRIPEFGPRASLVGLYLILIVIAVLAGRVVPFFTERALQVRLKRSLVTERVSYAALYALAALEVFWPASPLTPLAAIVAALAQAWRLAGWTARGVFQVPLLWVLWLGYAWIVLGLALMAGARIGLVPPALAIHAFAVGGVGVMTLGMMARVSLGHSGRMLQVTPVMVWSFGLALAAAVARVLLPLLVPSQQTLWVAVSGTFWVAAFAIFVVVYAPIFIAPRADGRPD